MDVQRDGDVYVVAARLWDVHTLRLECEWQPGTAYQDRVDVLEALVWKTG